MKRLLSLVTLVAALSAHAQGNYEAIRGFVGTEPTLGTLTGTAGWTFMPQTNMAVTALGALNSVVTSSGTVFVGLWNATGTLIASNAVNSSSTLVRDTRFEPILPVMLAPMQSYHLGAFAIGGTIGFTTIDVRSGDTLDLGPSLNLVGSATGLDSFTFPAADPEGLDFFLMAPNFQYSLVPEPSVTALAMVGGLVWLARKTRKLLSPSQEELGGLELRA